MSTYTAANAEKFVTENSADLVNGQFTGLIIECKGSTGCGPELKVYIEKLAELGAQCITLDGWISLHDVYHMRANDEQKTIMGELCPNYDFTAEI